MMKIKEKNKILSHVEVLRKIRRIAFEIYEHNFEEKEIVIAGIKDTGYKLAQLLAEQVQEVSSIKCELAEITLDKSANLQSEVTVTLGAAALTNKAVVIVDDVLNTGKTIVHSLKPFLKIHIRKVQVAVLVNRGHRTFPSSPDFVGYELSTTVNQHIEVYLMTNDNFAVYLS